MIDRRKILQAIFVTGVCPVWLKRKLLFSGESIKEKGKLKIEHKDSNGNILETHTMYNEIIDEGINYNLGEF